MRSFEKWRNTNPAAQRHISGDLHPQLHCCANLRCPNSITQPNETGCEITDWIQLAQDMLYWWDLLNTKINCEFPSKAGQFIFIHARCIRLHVIRAKTFKETLHVLAHVEWTTTVIWRINIVPYTRQSSAGCSPQRHGCNSMTVNVRVVLNIVTYGHTFFWVLRPSVVNK